MAYPYVVIDAAGYCGYEGRIYSRHQTYAAAARAARLPYAVVAHNEPERNGGRGWLPRDTFYADMPPRPVWISREG